MDGRERSTLEKWSRVKTCRKGYTARESYLLVNKITTTTTTQNARIYLVGLVVFTDVRDYGGSWNTLTFTASRGRPRSHARSEISGETPAGLGVTGWNQCCRSWRFRDKNLRFARVTAETPLTIGSQFLSLQRETILRLVFKERVQERERARSDQKPLERHAIRAQRSIPLDPTTRAR